MNKEELKKILKPIVLEAVKECLFEEGILSSVISEVVGGLVSSKLLETKKPATTIKEQVTSRPTVNREDELKQHKKKLLDAIGVSSYGGVNLFEGTTPMGAPLKEVEGSNPLGGMAPDDPGVDISSIFSLGGNKWKRLI